MNGKSTNIFAGPVRLVVKDIGDGLGFNFGSFWIWKNSNHQYFIKRTDNMYYSKKKEWINYFRDENGKPAIMTFKSLRTALQTATREVKVVDMDYDFTIQLETQKDEVNRFDLMEF